MALGCHHRFRDPRDPNAAICPTQAHNQGLRHSRHVATLRWMASSAAKERSLRAASTRLRRRDLGGVLLLGLGFLAGTGYKKGALPAFPLRPTINHITHQTTTTHTNMPLTVQIVSLTGVKDEDDFGKNDLYVRVSTDEKLWEQTSVKKGAGTQAVFNETIKLNTVVDPSAKLYIEVKDQDPGHDDKLGKAKYDLAPVISARGQPIDAQVELHRGLLHKKAGIITIRVSYI
ncbi:hypothetical protein DFS34DRAFT_601674 [Phlyctochytrium arcticum]|nr:hypothetical protein DFS34DRAFT_601674 [Phlyctochytrium arcticum]